MISASPGFSSIARSPQAAEIALERDQANYLVNVLRLKAGAQVLVFNGRDGEWRASLEAAGKKAMRLAVQ